MAFKIPKRKVAHIYTTELVDGVKRSVRENYNIVSLDRGDSDGPQVYLEPAAGALFNNVEDLDKADEVRTYDRTPFPGSRIGE